MDTQAEERYQPGDVVYHARRPEWGRGTVRRTQPVTHQGRTAQRLTIDFANHGRAVINTAVAQLSRKEPVATMNSTSTAAATKSRGWLDQLERDVAGANGTASELWTLPDTMSDPFASDAQRLAATLDSFRYSTEARSLIDWAVAQTGMDDPLSEYTRQELEQAFERYARDRDQHLKGLVQQIKRNGSRSDLDRALQQTRLPAAKAALQKAIRS